jgi:ferric-dicitrate binding protein FerR (iron transport regulator)
MIEHTKKDSIDRLHQLLNGLVDETLSAADERTLAELIAADPLARERYRQWMELHAALQWDYAAAALPGLSAEAVEGSVACRRTDGAARLASGHRFVLGSSLLVLCAVILAVSWTGARGVDHPGSTVEIIAVDGSASWSGRGDVRGHLAVGDRLQDGLVSLEGDSSVIGMRFQDGTLVTLVGASMLEFSDRGQKSLLLRHGSLSIDAQPQPKGRPMIVRTPSAEMEVVGTVFSVSANEKKTHLGVEEGSVRIRRLADGQVVEVPERQVAMASLDATLPLAAGLPSAMPAMFTSTCEEDSSLNREGRWLPAEGSLPARLRAVPRIAGRWPDGRPIIHHGVSLRAPDAGFVAFGPDGVVTIRCRMSMRETLRVMLNMRRPEGTFAGNFEAKLPLDPDDPGVDSDGWRTVTIPARDFLSIVDLHPTLTSDMVVAMLLVETFQSKADLEVSELRVDAVSVTTGGGS